VATDFTGGVSFNSGFLCRSFLNLTVKTLRNWSTFAEVIVKKNWPTYFWDTVYTPILSNVSKCTSDKHYTVRWRVQGA